MDHHILYFDGGSRPKDPINPNKGAGAAVLFKNGEIVSMRGKFIENTTNNIAEYTGLIVGLELADQFGVKKLTVKGDSQLVINQCTNRYKINKPHLYELYLEVKKFERTMEINYEHVMRCNNKEADSLCDQVIDKEHDL